MTANIPSSAQSSVDGWALTRLVRIHEAIRNDLALLQRVSAAVGTGDNATAVAVLQRLSISQPAWTLGTYCLAFCTFVHEHHQTEDDMLFPMLLQQIGGQDGDLATVIDKLTADHRAVAADLDRVQGRVGTLSDEPAARSAAVRAVEELRERLETHLNFEEEHLAPALIAISRLVSEAEVPPPPPEQMDGVSGYRRDAQA